MRKHRLVVEAAERAGASKVVGGRIVGMVLEGIVREVAQGGEVRLGLFGSFTCVEVSVGGDGKKVKAHREVRFVPGKKFRDALHV